MWPAGGLRLASVVGALVAVGCTQADKFEAHKALVRGYLEEVVNAGNAAAIPRFFPDSGWVLNGRLRTHDEILQTRDRILQAFPDGRLIIQDQVAEGNKVVTRVVFRGTHRGELMGIRPTGRTVEYGGIAIDRIEDGKVVQGWHQADEVGMLRQIGLFPPRQ